MRITTEHLVTFWSIRTTMFYKNVFAKS